VRAPNIDCHPEHHVSRRRVTSSMNSPSDPQMHRAPFIRVLLANEWETTNLNRPVHPERAQRAEGPAVAFILVAPCSVSGHDFTGCGKTRLRSNSQGLCIRARPHRLRKNSPPMQFAGALYQGTTSQAAEKLASDPIRRGSVSGHDFSRADKANRMSRALHVAEKLTALKGHDFSRATKPIESTWASAPAGCFPSNSPGIPPFSATCLAPAGGFSRSPYKTGPFSVVSY